jgi:nitroreductase
MEFAEIVHDRKSIRAFSAKRIPKDLITRILQQALRAPSAINLQPWEISVVMDDERERLSRRLIKTYREKKISCSPGNVKPMPSVFTTRGVESFESMKPYLDKMGFDFSTFINEGSCNFYGAPVALIVVIDNSFSKARLVDIGVFLGYFMLAAHNAGLSSCPIGLITAYEEDVKDIINIEDRKNIVIGIALGYPDYDVPINQFRSPRDDLEKFIRWV